MNRTPALKDEKPHENQEKREEKREEKLMLFHHIGKHD